MEWDNLRLVAVAFSVNLAVMLSVYSWANRNSSRSINAHVFEEKILFLFAKLSVVGWSLFGAYCMLRDVH